jgi:hypothetical protein
MVRSRLLLAVLPLVLLAASAHAQWAAQSLDVSGYTNVTPIDYNQGRMLASGRSSTGVFSYFIWDGTTAQAAFDPALLTAAGRTGFSPTSIDGNAIGGRAQIVGSPYQTSVYISGSTVTTFSAFGGNVAAMDGGNYVGFTDQGQGSKPTINRSEVLLGTNPQGFGKVDDISGNIAVGYVGGVNFGSNTHAVAWTPNGFGGWTGADIHPEALLGLNSISQASGVSAGRIVGYGQADSGASFQALVWENGVASDITPYALLGTRASASANSVFGDMILGFGRGSNTGNQDHMFLWESGGVTDLTALSTNGFSSFAVNFATPTGQLWGTALDASGQRRSVVLQRSGNSIPEPGTLVLLGIGALAGILGKRRRA